MWTLTDLMSSKWLRLESNTPSGGLARVLRIARLCNTYFDLSVTRGSVFYSALLERHVDWILKLLLVGGKVVLLPLGAQGCL